MSIPPRNGEGDRSAVPSGGGGPDILRQPIKQVRRARQLRRNMSLPEVLLWQELRKRPKGLKFRRQAPIDPYTVDFVCLAVRLAIEVDGKAHSRGNAPARDLERDRVLGGKGFTTMRVPAKDVLDNLESVVTAIVARCVELDPLHRPADGPPPRAGEDL